MMDDMLSSETKKRILIVDDNEDMRDLLAQILEEEGMYHLLFAEDGAQALDKAVRTLPHLILMDMSMPGMSGWEAVPRMRRIAELAHTPIIAITAHASAEDRARALALGCTLHLGKPFDIVQVIDAVARFLPAS
jgi:two-component system cell cycle response regulator DivK